MSSLPKHFISEGPARPLRPGPPVYALDVFVLSGPRAAGGEWIVAADANGDLSLLPMERRRELPASVQRELAAHLQLGPVRQLDLAALHLLAIEGLDAQAEFPGTNDLVRLRGTLRRRPASRVRGP